MLPAMNAPELARTNAALMATTIYGGYKRYRTAYATITASARDRYENADWQAVQEANGSRLALYKEHVTAAVADVQRALGRPAPTRAEWEICRDLYVRRLAGEYNAELFETFYNSAYRRLTSYGDVSDGTMFVTSCYPVPPVSSSEDVARVYRPVDGLLEMVREIARDLPLRRPWRDLERDLGNVLRSLAEERPEIETARDVSAQILEPVFFRNKGAYVVGRLDCDGQSWPLAFPILLDGHGRLYIDTLICDEDELSVLFSFTRAYFMVLTHHAHALVDFLSGLLPNKKRSELYASIGLYKHAKTVFYRDLLDHLEHSDDKFVIAAGVKGMVMTVFTLPSYQIVFKIIRDEFAPQKNITADEVREKYHIVKNHDRVGRMADTQEFRNLTLPRHRFDDELIRELLAVAPTAVDVDDAQVRIHHCYTERLMTPLNLYIDEASEVELVNALDEYGNAIKQLAAANIFPGDMLLKNFGVTRHGRVVFYDYDEICYLTDVRFRCLPEPSTPEQELASEPWYSVGPHDVFPQEFRRFLFGRRKIKDLFTRMHGELFDPEYWQGLQHAIEDGQVMDVFPYRRKKRFVSQPDEQVVEAQV